MIRRSPPLRLAGYVVVAAILGATPLVAEPELIVEDSAAILDLAGETRVVVTGLRGKISVRAGKSEEFRFMARSLEDRDTEIPVALWIEGRTLILKPVATRAGVRLQIELAVSPELAVEIETQDSQVHASSLHSALRVKGANIELDARGLRSSLDATIDGGRVRVDGAREDSALRGKKLTGTWGNGSGFLTIDVEESRLALQRFNGELEISMEESEISVDEGNAIVRAEGQGGKLDLRNLVRRIDVSGQETAITLTGCKGNIQVETDAEMSFRNLQGTVQVTGRDGTIRGAGVQGDLKIEAYGTSIQIADTSGELRIQGDHLTLQAKAMTGPTFIKTTGSEILIEEAGAALEVGNDYGTVEIRGAEKNVKVTSVNGDVNLSEMKGPVTVRAEGALVDVQFASLADSTIENNGGDVTVHLPGGAAGRVEAHAPNGTVYSEIDDIKVTSDSTAASGMMKRAPKPILKIRSSGDVYLRASVAAPPGGP